MRDSSGEIQLFALESVTADFDEFTKLHLGDWVGVGGEVVRTKRGELSVKVATWVTLADGPAQLRRQVGRHRRLRPALSPPRGRPLGEPDVAHDAQAAQRRDARGARTLLGGQDFMEVETPILNAIASGSDARPFATHHNALDTDFFLRIAPELWLKRLVVGGFERVFEIGRVFRNEGVSPRHNPEFTMLEIYAAYWNYEDMMNFTEELTAGRGHGRARHDRGRVPGPAVLLRHALAPSHHGRTHERGGRRGRIGPHAARAPGGVAPRTRRRGAPRLGRGTVPGRTIRSRPARRHCGIPSS